MSMESLLRKSIKKWEKNLRRLEEMNWKQFSSKLTCAKHDILLFDKYFPLKLYGSSCPLCQHYRHKQCPLAEDAQCDDTCCAEWQEAVRYTRESSNKAAVRKSYVAMIERLKWELVRRHYD